MGGEQEGSGRGAKGRTDCQRNMSTSTHTAGHTLSLSLSLSFFLPCHSLTPTLILSLPHSPAMMLAAMFCAAVWLFLIGRTPSNSSLPSPDRLAVLILWV